MNDNRDVTGPIWSIASDGRLVIHHYFELSAVWQKPSSTLSRPVLTAPVSAVSVLFDTVRARPSPFRSVKPASRRPGGRFDGTERAGMRSDGCEQGPEQR